MRILKFIKGVNPLKPLPDGRKDFVRDVVRKGFVKCAGKLTQGEGRNGETIK